MSHASFPVFSGALNTNVTKVTASPLPIRAITTGFSRMCKCFGAAVGCGGEEGQVVMLTIFSLTLRRLMSYIYIYGAPILDVSRSHTTTQHSR